MTISPIWSNDQYGRVQFPIWAGPMINNYGPVQWPIWAYPMTNNDGPVHWPTWACPMTNMGLSNDQYGPVQLPIIMGLSNGQYGRVHWPIWTCPVANMGLSNAGQERQERQIRILPKRRPSAVCIIEIGPIIAYNNIIIGCIKAVIQL